MLASEVDQVTVLSVALSGLTVAVSVSASPSTNSTDVLLSSTDSTAMTFLATTTLQVADLSPAFAVIVASPSLTAVTLPLSTVAIAASEVDQVTVLSVALSGLTVAVSVSASPSTNSTDVLLSTTDSTAMTFLVTTTLQVADLSPTLAVMVASPSLIAVTLPLSTVAILALDVDQVTVLSVASSGLIETNNASESPSTSDSSVLFRSTEETAITPLLTVTMQEPFFPPALAVIVEEPSAIAVTNPVSETVATDCFEDAHETVLSVASPGETLAFN